MRILFFLVSLLIILLQASFAKGLSSEELSYQRTQDRLERLERDLNMVQQQVFRGDVQAPKLSRKERKTYPKLEVRIVELEESIRKLNGKFEEVEFSINNVAQKLDKIIADIDFRISSLENIKNQMTDKVAAVSPQSDSLEDVNAEKSVNAENVGNVEVVGSLEKTSIEAIEVDIVGQYEKAFEHLRQSKYDKAEVALKDFIKNNDESDLKGNAYYWLGETYYVRENYEQAAVHFLKGYQGLPKGNKAADNLLKLAMSLDKLKKQKEACTTFDKLLNEFPSADGDILDKVNSEKKRLQC